MAKYFFQILNGIDTNDIFIFLSLYETGSFRKKK